MRYFTATQTLTKNLTLTQNLTMTHNLTLTQNLTSTQNLTLTQNLILTQIDFADKGFIIKTLFLRAFLVNTKNVALLSYNARKRSLLKRNCQVKDYVGVLRLMSTRLPTRWTLSASAGRPQDWMSFASRPWHEDADDVSLRRLRSAGLQMLERARPV